MSCKHSHFWILEGHAWCPDCGAIRKIIETESSTIFVWKRWLKPEGQEKTHKNLQKYRKHRKDLGGPVRYLFTF